MSKGLQGVLAATTSITTVGVESTGLNYRGYSVEDLAAKCRVFEEVAYLLLMGKLPNQTELNDFMYSISSQRSLPVVLKSTLELIPGDVHSMDVLRTGTSMLGAIEGEEIPMGSECKYDANKQVEVAIRLLATVPGMLLYWYHFHTHGIRIETETPSLKSESENSVSIAEHWFRMLFAHDPISVDSISPEIIRALNVSLILYADHDLNASTFAARVTTATMSDFHSAVTTAIGTLKGPLHGGASEAAMDMLIGIDSEDAAEEKVARMLSKKELVMGFGHRVYKKGDPRSDIVKSLAKTLVGLPTAKDSKCFAIAERIECLMLEQKMLHPNLDFYTAVLYHLSGIPIKFFTAIFAISRITGWSAHIFEQRANNRLIRPSSVYVGPSPRSFIPIEDRDDDDNSTSRL